MSKYFRASVLSVISICVLSIFSVGCEEEAKPEDGTTPVVTGPCTGKVIYTVAVPDGNFGGASGADSICNTNKPAGSGSTFKALVTDSTRRACDTGGNDNCYSAGSGGQSNWVLPASSTLCTTDGKLVGTTDARKFIDYIYPGVLSASATSTYSGFNITFGLALGQNCTDFSSTSGTSRAASASVGLAGFISASSKSCSTAGTIYCVEQ